jgi:PIN domain nuclease of toxin-antitoxin system
MMIILDTHIWLRWIIQSGRGLPADILAAIHSESRVAVSAISCFEVPYLLKRRRITLPLPVEA